MAKPSVASASIEQILIIDDEPPFHRAIREAFPHRSFDGVASVEKMWDRLRSKEHYALILLDLVLERDANAAAGVALIPEILKVRPNVPIIVATQQDDVALAVEAMRQGAKYFFNKKNFKPETWDQKFAELLLQQPTATPPLPDPPETPQVTPPKPVSDDEKFRFVGEDPKIIKIKDILAALADVPEVTVLLTGETGTGKEVAARYLHKSGPRSDKPFVAVDLSTLSKELMESQLFGAKKGAYTGATEEIAGYFAQANGGVLLLDEIGEISLELQVKLLRFLEHRIIRPLGASQDIQLDIQIVTATNRNLSEEVKTGKFKHDLYQRLNNFVVELPPLRQRIGDLLPILKHYLRLKMGDEMLTWVLAPEVFDCLLRYNWPGNVRELRNALDVMLINRKVNKLDRVDETCLPQSIRYFNPQGGPLSVPALTPPSVPTRKERETLEDPRKIEAALSDTNSNKTRTAQQLGYGGTDHLRSRISICYKNYPHLFDDFPLIRATWPNIVKPQ